MTLINMGTLNHRKVETDAGSLNAARAAFFLGGLGLSAWAPLVPYVQARLGLTSSELGVFLLCIGIGSVISMPLAGPLSSRFGCRVILCIADIIFCLALPVLSICNSRPLLAVALLAFGGAVGANGVAMIVQASLVERAIGRPIMSSLQALWSIGGIVGAGGMTLLLAQDVSPLYASLMASLIIITTLCLFMKRFLTHGGTSGPAFVIPKGSVVLLGIIACIVYLVEGMMLDWSAIILNKISHVPVFYAGAGYMTFACLMVAGRLQGDKLVKKYGQRNVLLSGLVITAFGLIFAATISHPWAGFVGLSLVGLGASNVVPILYRVAGNSAVMPANLAIAAVATFGYMGVLSGPAFIGFLAGTAGLTFAISVVAIITLLAAFAGKAIHD